MRALWGQPPHEGPYRQEQEVKVEVEPGTAGRFWCLEVRYGDSHNYSNVNITFDGVPPFLARSPEEWFNPVTGQVPQVPLYDETPFIQSARIESVLQDRWPDLQHWSPAPSLGDPDGAEIIGDARFALWNPEGRELGFRIGTYLPRQKQDDPAMARLRMTAGERELLDESVSLLHVHGKGGKPRRQIDARGVIIADVSEAERWFAYTYPATPLVLIGQGTKAGSRFTLSVGVARNWYFRVPKGVEAFRVSAETLIEHDDVADVAVRTPDRTLARIYGRSGETTVTVPEGMDGKIWHLRLKVGSGTRMIARTEPPFRYQDMTLRITLDGVPGLLAPTWEQWFHPDRPERPMQRAR